MMFALFKKAGSARDRLFLREKQCVSYRIRELIRLFDHSGRDDGFHGSDGFYGEVF